MPGLANDLLRLAALATSPIRSLGDIALTFDVSPVYFWLLVWAQHNQASFVAFWIHIGAAQRRFSVTLLGNASVS